MTWNYEYFSNLQDIQSKLIFVQHKDFEPLSLQHKWDNQAVGLEGL